ncbi:MAG: hypothetical protein AAGH78_10495, partial [Cyanobacteria bacterium P01_H01_bin.58]
MINAFSGIAPVDDVVDGQIGAVKVTVLPGSGINKSTFNDQSFTVENIGDKRIAAIYIDITDAVLKDAVFDPTGEAGDTASRGLTYSSTGSTGAIEYALRDTAPFFGVGGPSGYEGLLLTFDPNVSDGYNSGEIVQFGVDTDPNSIIGIEQNPTDINGDDPSLNWDIGGVSGAELINSKIHVLFTDGTEAIGELVSDGSQGGSIAVASQSSSDKQATLSVNDISEGGAGTYSQSDIEVLVAGDAGDVARITLAKGFIQPFDYIDSNGNPVNLSDQFVGAPFPANQVIQFQTVDIPLDGTTQDITTQFDFGAPGGNLAFEGDDLLPIAFTVSIIDGNQLPVGSTSEPIYLTHTAAGQSLPPVDTTAPTASLLASDLTAASSEPFTFTVTYSDDVAVDASTVDATDV